MDPISQAVLGAAAAHLAFGRRLPRAAALIGAAAGMVPDLDVLIAFGDDPTAGWVWHRGPTHSLVAIPIGGVLSALPFLLVPSLRKHWKAVIGASVIAFATHAPLDALTSYGTQLFWPFTDHRVALDWMPIIDPVWTLMMVLGVILAVWRKSIVPTAVVLCLGLLYFGFGAFQHERAMAALERVAQEAGHDDATNLRAMPSPASLALWHGIYKHGDELHAIGIRTGYLGATAVKIGMPRPLADAEEVAGSEGTETRRQFEVFQWFSDDTLYLPEPDARPQVVADGRYSSDPAAHEPLWGLDFTGDAVRHYRPPRRFDARGLLRTMFGNDPSYRPLP